MKTQPHLTAIANKHYHPNKPIKYWECWRTDKQGKPYVLCDWNNSIEILRNKYGRIGFIYKSVR